MTILGYGAIGAALEARLEPFEVDLIRVARHARPGVHAVSELPQLLPRSNVLVVLLPLTRETRGLVDGQVLSLLPAGALLVNAGRGPVVDTDALLERLSSGELTAALDVTDPEPLPPEHPLWRAAGTFITPHVAGATQPAEVRAFTLVGEQIGRWARASRCHTWSTATGSGSNRVGIGQAFAIGGAGLAAGAINVVVGSGTLITFPVLLAFGYAPVPPLTNTVGLVPAGLRRRRLSPRAGGTGRAGEAPRRDVGGGRDHRRGLLLALPSSAFKAIVPVFIAAALALTLAQPRLNRWLGETDDSTTAARLLTPAGVYFAGVYGGYFGAAQGILLLAILGVTLAQSLQRTNALKNVLVGIVNGVAAIYFIFAADVRWAPAAIIAGASIVGGQLGARYGRLLAPQVLRGLIVVVGLAAIVQLLTQ